MGQFQPQVRFLYFFDNHSLVLYIREKVIRKSHVVYLHMAKKNSLRFFCISMKYYLKKLNFRIVNHKKNSVFQADIDQLQRLIYVIYIRIYVSV